MTTKASFKNTAEKQARLQTDVAALEACVQKLRREAPALFNKLAVAAVMPEAANDRYLTKAKGCRFLFKIAAADIRRSGGGGAYYKGESLIFVGVTPNRPQTVWHDPVRVLRHEVGHYLDEILPFEPDTTAINGGQHGEMVADTFALLLHLRDTPTEPRMATMNVSARRQALKKHGAWSHYTVPAVKLAVSWAKTVDLTTQSLEDLLHRARACATAGMAALPQDAVYQKHSPFTSRR